MKVKSIYIYLGIFIVIVLGIILMDNSSSESEKSAVAKTEMPNDAIHQGARGEMPNDAIHQGARGKMPNDAIHGKANQNGPSKADVLPSYYKKLDSLATAFSKNPDDTAVGLEYAHYLAAGHQTDKALNVYNKLLKAAPKSKSILMEASYLSFQKKNYDKSQSFIEDIIKYYPNDMNARYNKALILFFKKDTVNAVKIWKDVAERSPKSEEGKLSANMIKELKK